ncbi:MTH538 TIR-like domain [Alkalibacterium subtropicum]|uniref:MTH538 TIR-like domain n=1 Tax=Alkalibacterium subtropicum TaxID=753702 RepID=A0A1I1ES46_9LACT|nr:TIR domain-containing protein [Alkalibacterium subtropicum]SFB89959.1 MTH538 TIR-like domain [Alkalibacterium subtropicum]
MVDKHKCFISFKSKNMDYKEHIQEELNVDMIDKSLNEPINSFDEDYIMAKIRSDYLYDSTVTIHLIGEHGSENNFLENQYYIKKELQASLSNTANHNKSGILGVVLPEVYSKIFSGKRTCSTCGEEHNMLVINDSTVVKEFSYNYFIPNDKCSWSEDDRYCVLVKWDDFVKTPNDYIHQAYEKRFEQIAKKTKVRPK